MEKTLKDQSGEERDQTRMRRAPTQKRSRERVDHILACATDLIAAHGSDTMRMSELAERAGISIGSLYQYFPDKAAIVRALAERCNAESRNCIEEGLAGVETPDDLEQAFNALIDTYYQLFLTEPVMRDIWSGMQADATLRALELEESRENARILTRTLLRLRPDGEHAAIESAAMLVMSLGEAAMRLAISVERDEGDRLVATYKRMATVELKRLVAAAPPLP